MIIEVSSGKAGFKEYLEHGQKQGREFHRDELDQRVPLHGDLTAWALACEDAAAKGNQYDHFTLSFTEDYVSDEMLQKAVDEFRDHLFAAWPESERYRIPFYAEAHRPKIQTYTHAETGELIKRKTHIHIGVGRHDLLTGKHVQLTGYLGQDATGNIKYLDAFQESFNARHGFRSPKESPRVTPENAIDILARYTGQKPNELGTFNARKADLETKIQRAIIDQDVTSWAGFGELLKRFGAVSKVRAGKINESFAVTPHDGSRRMRLEGVFFQREFITRPTAEKVAIIQERAREAYLQQMLPRTAPAYVAEVLDEWHRFKSREIRHLHTGSDAYKNVYLPADAARREQILDDLERETDGIQSPADRPQRQAAPARNRLQKLPVRDLDAVQRRSEMLLRGDDDMDVSTAPAGEPVGVGVRQADGGGTGDSRSRARGPLTQPSSVLTRLQDDLRERYEQAEAKQKFAEIRRHIDGGQLLARLSHSHGVRAGIYGVSKAADGSTRIVCGTQALSANDFLTKHLGMPWREAAPILREVYELQIGKRVVRARGPQDGIEARRLWQAFQATRGDPAVKERLEQFDGQTIVARRALAAKLKREGAQALAGLGREQRRAVRAAEMLRAATLKAEFNEARKGERRTLKPPQKEAWRDFLQQQAQAGDLAALRVLRRLDDTARAKEDEGITITGVGLAEDEKKRRTLAASSVLKALSTRVDRSGDVTFFRAGQAVLRDEGKRLQVLDPNSDDTIVAGLLLAQQMYGHTLTLTGPAEFQARAVALAVEHRMPVRFADPQLEAMRLQLHANRFKPTPQQRAEKPPVAEVEMEALAAPEAAATVQDAGQQPEPEQQPQEQEQVQAAAPSESGDAALEVFLELHKELPWASKEVAQHGTVVEACGQHAVLHTGRGKHVMYEFPEEQEVPAHGQSLEQLQRGRRSDVER